MYSLALGIMLGSPITAAAQIQAKPSAAVKPRTLKWEVSFRGGLALGTSAPDPVIKLPLAGETFTMADGLTPTRAIPSWFFGDGAALLNQVLLLRGSNTRMDALESHWPIASRRTGPQIGASLAGQVHGGLWLEVAADLGMDPLGFAGPAKDGIEAARAGYERAITALAGTATTIIASSNITATADVASGGRRLLTSFLVHYRGTAPGYRPYLLAGFGFAVALGGEAKATLTGTNRFTTSSQATIEETDTIVIRYKQTSTPVWTLGGGMERDLSRTSAFRVEARVLISALSYTGYLDTSPSATTATPGSALVLNATTPGVQFSSISGIRPTLSGSRYNGFQVLKTESNGIQWVVSGAYVRRF